MGITGMLIGVLLAATAYRLLRKNVTHKPVLAGGDGSGADKTAEEMFHSQNNS